MLLAGYNAGMMLGPETTATYTVAKIIDAMNRDVVITKPPERVVSLAPSVTEILFALGLGDKVVGVTSFCNYPPQVVNMTKEGKIEIVGGYLDLNVEKVIALNPDLVIGLANSMIHTNLKSQFEELGINIVYVKGGDARNDEEVFRDIMIIASIFGVEDRARELIDDIKNEISSVVNQLQALNITRPKVLVLLGPPSWGLWSVGGDTYLGWIIEKVGGVNIADRYSGWPQLSIEYVLEQDPEVIIITLTDTEINVEDVINEIRGSYLSETKAFKEGRIYVVAQEANDILVRPGPRIGKAVNLMAQILHPKIFGEPNISLVYKMRTS